jgi:hypothetical protein
MSTAGYKYQPLDSTSGDIRLIQLHCADDNYGLVHCNINHFSHGRIPPYDCLSYTWGDQTKTKPIHLNGNIFYITQNLHDALLQLQDRDSLAIWQNTWLWIDAICINQTDEEEKSSQVQQMKSIFVNSQQVILWLGVQSSDSKHALWLLDHIAYMWQAYHSLEMTEEQRLSRMWDELISKEDFHGIKALRLLFERPWWTRVWVYQEAMSAKQSRIVCGPHSARLESFSVFYSINNGWRQLPAKWRSSSWEALYPELISAVRRTKQVQSSIQLSKGASRPVLAVLDQVYVHALVQASDPRDRLFALYGLETNAEELGLRVDYSKTCGEVYEETARALLRKYGLVVLSYCSGQRQYHSKLTLPSWVPNWEEYITPPIHAFPSTGRKYNSDSKFFSVSGSTSQPKLPSCHLDGKLELTAVQVGVIAGTGSSWPFSPLTVADTGRSHEAEHRWVNDIQSLVGLHMSDYRSELHSEQMSAVWRIAVADHLHKPGLGYTRATVEDAGGYDAYVQLLELSNRSTGHENYSQTRKTLERQSWDYRKSLVNCAMQRRPICSEDGRVGIGPDLCQADDIICVFHGARIPFIVRKCESGEYRLIGEAYVHGIMDGEYIAENPRAETLVLC